MSRLLCNTILASCLISASAFADEPLKGRVETNLRAGHERSIFMTEFWVPFAQSDSKDNILYGSLRMMGDNQDSREGNLGVGYRQVIDTKGFKGVAGIHGWLDRRITERGSKFHQITTGVEWLGESVDVRLNGYIPLSDKREIEIPNANPQGPELAGTGIVVDTNGTILEEPQGGFDLELGLELGQYSDFIRDNTDRFHVYAGGYYFDGPNTEDVAGWRTRFTADVTQNIQFGARFQRDDVRGSQGFLEATFRFPFGHKKSYRKEGIRARLDESPERDIDIVTNDVVTDTGDRVQVLNAETGTAQEVLHVNNTAAGGGDGSADNPFNTLADAQSAASEQAIIYVNAGDGTSTNQDQGIALDKKGQQLIGSGSAFIYDGGRFNTANGASPTSIIIAPAGAAPVIGNVNAGQDGVTVSADDVMVAGVTVDNAATGRDGIVVQADGAAASAQNVTIQNVTARNNRMGLYIHGTNDGAVSAKVEGSITTANSQHGIAVYDDTNGTFEADLGGGSMGSAGNNVLAGNTLEDLAVEYDGRALSAQNNWWGQASGADTDTPDIGIRPQIYYGAPINDGLVGHWTFDNEWTNNMTAFDRSGLSNDGTLEGGLSLADQVAGENREALEFDGSSDYVEIPHSTSLLISDGISILTWVNATPQVADPWSTYIKKDGYGDGWFLSARDNTANSHARVDTDAGFNDTILITGGLDDNWNQIAVTMNAGIMETYMNINNLTNFYNQGSGFGNTSNMYIGGSDGSNYFTGSIDETRIYNRALSANEVSELYRMDTSSSVDTGGFLTAAP